MLEVDDSKIADLTHLKNLPLIRKNENEFGQLGA